jgi:WD40 repeat protein
LFALEALQRGPTTLTHGLGELAGQVQAIFTLAFSPDGHWIASGDDEGNVVLWPDDGGEPILLDSHESPDFVWNEVAFGTRGKRLVSHQDTLKIWSVPEGRMLREQELPPMTSGLVRGDRFFSFTTEGSEEVLRSWPLDGEEPRLVGRVPWANVFPPWNIDASGSWLAFAEGHTLRVRSLNDWTVRPRLVGRHEADVQRLEFHPDGDRLASVDASGEIRLWSLEAEGEEPLRILLGDAGPQGLEISPDGSWLAVTVHPPGSKTSIQLWDMNAPVDADPTRLPHQSYASLAFHPSGRWLVTTNESSLNLHPLTRRYARVLRGHQGIVMGLGVAPDGSWLASTSHDLADARDGWARIWSLEAGGRSREVVAGIQTLAHSIDFDSAGQHLLLPKSRTGAQLARVDGGPPRALEGAPPHIVAVALSPDGRLAAAAPYSGPAGEKVMHVWDLPSGEHRTLGPLPGAGGGFAGGVWDLEFSHDGQLFSIGDGVGGITRWNVEQGTVEVLRRGSWGLYGEIALSADGRRLFSRTGTGFAKLATMVGNLEVLDLESGKVQSLDSHGQRILGLALGARGEILATGDTEGTLRVGPVSGETPHVFFGHDGLIDEVAVDPHGRWVASAGADATIRVWPMPQGPPFHTLPYEELLDRLRAVTNLRVVPDEQSASGYRTEIGPFPGWAEVPEW